VHREQRRAVELGESVEQHREAVRVVDVLGPVQRREDEPVGVDAGLFEHACLGRRAGEEGGDGVDDGVARHDDPFDRNSLGQQVVAVDGGGGEAEIGEMVDQHSVVLFGHQAIEAAQSRLHVHQGHLASVRGQRAGDRGVRIALDHDGRRSQIGEQSIEAVRGHPDLLTPRAPADVELGVRRPEPELLEEAGRHRRVIVLARVYCVRTGSEASDDARELDQLRARPEHHCDLAPCHPTLRPWPRLARPDFS
jgi:hypothetical protein